ncbi:MAG: hypothetical protein K2K48_03115 [Anaeroplasmataceae bacterium]|nr:hypothetical protein [Anaeroplasmataceae bacterium]
MNKDKGFLNFVNDNIEFQPDYDLIASKIEAEQYLNNSKSIKKSFKNSFDFKKKILIRSLIIFLYTVCICIISVFSTLLIQYNLDTNSQHNADPSKLDAKYLEEHFDIFVAFGGGPTEMFPIDLLLNSDLIKEEDKPILSEYNSSCKGFNNRYYNVYLGVKDGKDVVELHHLSDPYKIFEFSSNLNYSFESIIYDFEKKSGENLTQDFLCGADLDKSRKTQGIFVDFKFLEDGSYGVYFISTIKDRVYIIDK